MLYKVPKVWWNVASKFHKQRHFKDKYFVIYKYDFFCVMNAYLFHVEMLK